MSNFEHFSGRMIAPKTLAAEAGVSVCTIHRWICAGKIQATKLSSKCVRIDGTSVAEFLAANVKPGFSA